MTVNANYDGMVRDLYDFAKNNEIGTSKRQKLYEQIEEAASSIEHLIDEGKTKEAEHLAKTILKTFEKFEKDRPEGLSKWISANTTRSGGYVKGALIPINHLARALRSATEEEAAYSRSLLNFAYTYFSKTIPENIDSAATDLAKNADFSIHGHKHGQEPVFPPEILNRIIENSVQVNSTKESKGLRQASKKVAQQAANAYRRPLRHLKISTADQAIEYVKEYGKELKYIDITGIDFSENYELKEFSESNKLRELIECLPNLKTFIASNIKLDMEGVEAIASSKNLKGLAELDLSYNSLVVKDEKIFSNFEIFIKLNNLDLRNTKIKIETFKAIANSGMKNLESLDLGACKIVLGNEERSLGNEELKILSDSGILKNAKMLGLQGVKIGIEGAEALVRSKIENTCEDFETLNLSFTQLGNKELKILIESGILKNVKALNLSANKNLGVDGVKILANSGIEGLERLELKYCEITEKEIRVLVNSGILKDIRTLKLGVNEIGNEGAKALSECLIENLEVLDLSSNAISENGLMDLISSEFKILEGVKELNLSFNQIGGGINILAKGSFKNLESLILVQTNSDIKELVNSDIMKNLKTLDLSQNYIKNKVIHLASSKKLENLETLILSFCWIRDKGAKILASAKSLKHLKTLVLSSGNSITYSGARALCDSQELKSLETLDLRDYNSGLFGFYPTPPKNWNVIFH